MMVMIGDVLLVMIFGFYLLILMLMVCDIMKFGERRTLADKKTGHIIMTIMTKEPFI